LAKQRPNPELGRSVVVNVFALMTAFDYSKSKCKICSTMIGETGLVFILVLVLDRVVANFEDDNLEIEWRMGVTIPGE
jgi:hypothetical protein